MKHSTRKNTQVVSRMSAAPRTLSKGQSSSAHGFKLGHATLGPKNGYVGSPHRARASSRQKQLTTGRGSYPDRGATSPRRRETLVEGNQRRSFTRTGGGEARRRARSGGGSGEVDGAGSEPAPNRARAIPTELALEERARAARLLRLVRALARVLQRPSYFIARATAPHAMRDRTARCTALQRATGIYCPSKIGRTV